MTPTLQGTMGPVAAPTRVRRRRVGRRAVALSVVLVVLSGLAVALLVAYAQGGQLYLAVARPVAYGAQIEADDLVVVRLNPDSALAPVRESDRASVVGKYAAVPLVPGSLVTRGHLAEEAIPGPGRQVVSVSLRAEQAPAHPLQAGAAVLLVRTPEGGSVPSGTAANQPALAPTSVPGTVRAVRELDYGAGVVVDVVVAESDGPMLAAAASSGRVAVVVTAGG